MPDILIDPKASQTYKQVNIPAAPLSRKGDAHQGQVFYCAKHDSGGMMNTTHPIWK